VGCSASACIDRGGKLLASAGKRLPCDAFTRSCEDVCGWYSLSMATPSSALPYSCVSNERASSGGGVAKRLSGTCASVV